MFFLGSLNGLLGEICGAVTEYCRINCCVCTFLFTPAQEAALLKKKTKREKFIITQNKTKT